ncbi:transcriptional regulator [Nocardiopsis terrae]|uniref:Transcriptional regulator with XRE-family HTH domain n=1 Tax=Nocardiopsis terrae TaxID=372655 RepID=A0ABR9HAK8_9ACTN|nr:XRE family transcriptional regulator [Nocardiopsis terrae]MBE1455936.1 transcriptional regulator with XRE-family HTH domain [Nocardiopsis terrae]GHC96617.1 transcriptional regulator [Nocardiopsis terrae]
MTDLRDMLAKRPVDREAVDRHKQRLLDEVRAYRLRELREAAELTQVQLSRQLNVSQSRVSNIERGEIDHTEVDTLRKYVEALGGKLSVTMEIGGESFPIV